MLDFRFVSTKMSENSNDVNKSKFPRKIEFEMSEKIIEISNVRFNKFLKIHFLELSILDPENFSDIFALS